MANKDRYNIKYVLQLGDVVNNDVAIQWTNAQAALTMLDGVVPYAIAPGNHDFSSLRRSALDPVQQLLPARQVSGLADVRRRAGGGPAGQQLSPVQRRGRGLAGVRPGIRAAQRHGGLGQPDRQQLPRAQEDPDHPRLRV